MPYSILGLHGWAGSGKTTTKNAVVRFVARKEGSLADCHKTIVHTCSYADPLKKICIAMFGDYPNWYGTQAEKNEVIPGATGLFPGVITFRDAMKFVGTDIFREKVDKEVWVKLMSIRIAQLITDPLTESRKHIIIIDDVRFPNEARQILNNYGSVLRILKTDQVSDDTHASEQVLEDSYLTKTLEFQTADDIEESAGYIYSIAIGNAR